jgi:branched-chain amino acid transport system substrate-binding protein
MQMMRPYIRLVRSRLLLVAVLMLLPVVSRSALAQSGDPILVGVVVPMTGPLATYGSPFSDAIELAVDEVNASGGVNGRPIKLQIEDSQASNTVAINALNRLLQSKPVAMFGPGLGTQILAMMPIFEKEHLPTFAGPSTRRVSQQGAKYFFRTTSHDGLTKELVTRFILENLGKTHVGIIHVANEWGYSGRDNVTAYLEQFKHLKPVSIASYQPTDRDFTAQLLQMKNDGADVIFTQGHPVDEALIARQLKQLNIDLPHVGSGSLCSAVLRHLLTTAEAAGQYCEGPDILPENNSKPRVQEYVKKYIAKAKFSPGIYETSYYDVAHMLAEVMKKYGTDRESIAKGMREMSYDGVVGTYRADAEGNLWQGAAITEFLPDGSAKTVRVSNGSEGQ